MQALDTRRDSDMHGMPGTGGRGRVGCGRGTPISGGVWLMNDR
jgi:hypothetical protein